MCNVRPGTISGSEQGIKRTMYRRTAVHRYTGTTEQDREQREVDPGPGPGPGLNRVHVVRVAGWRVGRHFSPAAGGTPANRQLRTSAPLINDDVLPSASRLLHFSLRRVVSLSPILDPANLINYGERDNSIFPSTHASTPTPTIYLAIFQSNAFKT